MRTATLSRLSLLTIAGLVVTGLALFFVVWMRGAFVPAGFAFAGIPLVMAVLVATRVRWMLPLAGLVGLLYLLEALQGRPGAGGMTSPPAEILPFMWLDAARVVETAGSAVAAVAGIAATLRQERPSRESA